MTTIDTVNLLINISDNMKLRIMPNKLEMLDAFEEYISKGGSILSFAEYYNAKNENCEFEPEKQVILLALCEELAITGDYHKIFLILNTIFSVERWTLNSFKRFMACVKESMLLQPLYGSIFALHENCKNYMKSISD